MLFDELILEIEQKTPLFLESMGEYLLFQIDEGFRNERSPDGTPWQPDSPATKLQKTTDKILQELGTRGGLRGMISYEVNAESLSISAIKPYATTHQFGARRGEFGKTNRNTGIPFGDIPARPFLPDPMPESWAEELENIIADTLFKPI